MMVDDAQFSWHETLGVPPGAATDEIDRTVRRLARHYAPDRGGTEAQQTRIETTCARARITAENRSPAQAAPLPSPPLIMSGRSQHRVHGGGTGGSASNRAPWSAISWSTTARCSAKRCGDPGTRSAADTRLNRA
jgi:hypothetical protein